MLNQLILNLARKIVCPVLSKFEPPLMRSGSWGGDFPDKTFLVIRRNEPQAGLCSLVQTNLAWFRFAEQHGMIPVVDMQTTRNVYQRRGERGHVNAWEFFFEQPAGYTLEMIRRASRVVIATGALPAPGFLPSLDGELTEWREIAKRCLRVRHEALAGFANEAVEREKDGAIGVLARGTDYVSLRPKGHPVQPTAAQLIAKVREGGESKRIFLVTEDKSIRDEFKQAFGSRLIVARQDFVDYSGGYLADCRGVKNDRERGLAYLKAIVDLARCPEIIAGRTSGTLVAALLADRLPRAYYFDLGCY